MSERKGGAKPAERNRVRESGGPAAGGDSVQGGRTRLGSAKVSPARAAAFAILERVENTSAHSDDLLHGPGMSGLSQADRNLATTLVLGVLRWQIALDARIKPLLQRPETALASPVATAARLGAFQLLHLDRIPAHAALSESVELVRSAGHAHATGMVNAVLRKLTRQELVRPKLYEPVAALAERLGHPGWLVERWVREYGRAAATAVCEYDQQPPGQGGLFAPGAGFESGSESGVEVEAETEAGWPRMDDGSRLVAELTAASWSPDGPSERIWAQQIWAGRIWDCCAAPGGKTMVLARRLPQAELLATDVNLRRVRALAQRFERAGARVRVMEADAAKLDAAEGEFDLVLCDVPCSGTGTLARNPEIRLRLAPAELSRQAKRQGEILRAALARLKPGGRLVYSTCSLEPEENEQVVEAVCADGGIEVLPVEPLLRQLSESGVLAAGMEVGGLVRGSYLRTLPGVGFQGDGFFAALLTRTAGKASSSLLDC